MWRQDSLDSEGRLPSQGRAGVRTAGSAPQIYFGGSSPAALPIAAEYVDVYLTWGEPPAAAAAKVEQVRKLAAARGRKVRFGIRLHTISRDTSSAAWAVADELLAELTPEQIANATELHAKSESEGQRRMTALHGGQVDNLEIYPNLWAGVGLVRGGAGTALVGSHEEVAEPDLRIRLGRLRRVHPLRLPAPGGGVLVRRRCSAAVEAQGRRLTPRADVPTRQQTQRTPTRRQKRCVCVCSRR